MNIPIVSLDKIYLNIDNQNIYFLDCTRVDGNNNLVTRRLTSIDIEIDILSKNIKSKQIILADDVVFSGSVLRMIINKFQKNGIEVVGIICSVSTEKAYNFFNNILKYGIKTNYLMSEEVIDQVCERDFYFGIAGSGILVKYLDNLYKAPYFKPYGNPISRASIPCEYEKSFSIGCLDRSIYLWSEIDKLKSCKAKIKELPEPIIYTDSNQEVVKTLKKERKNI